MPLLTRAPAGFRPAGAEVLLWPAWTTNGLVDHVFDWFVDLTTETTVAETAEDAALAVDEANEADTGASA